MTNRYSRYKTIPLEIAIMAIRTGVKMEDSKSAGVQSLRLRTFAEKGTQCVYCGRKAAYFAVEKSAASNNDSHHLNLWGTDENGKEILFTHDHVIARGFGGPDTIENSVPACEPCNSRKSMYEDRMLKTARNKKIEPTPEWLANEIKIRYDNPEVLKFWFM